jgi:hypothetical protein
MPLFALALSAAQATTGPEVVECLPLTESILMIHLNEGKVIYHQAGQKRSDDRVIVNPLNSERAHNASNYRITSPQDPSYAMPVTPSRIGRKSKGTEFAWFVDKWENDRAVNTRPDHRKEHWIYLQLPKPMREGSEYLVTLQGLVAGNGEVRLRFDPTQTRSEAVHVNQVGYVPNAPRKYGYVYHWAGDWGQIDFSFLGGQPFHLIDEKGARVFTGKVALHMPHWSAETLHVTDSPPFGNYQNADVYECDFSAFRTPGTYRLSVPGVGTGFPIRIDANAYREPFRAVARALYHNRSGIALKKPYTEFERPAPHHPKLTPGFAGKLMYTRIPFAGWGSEGGDAAKLRAEFAGPLDAWGWYQDAGDWDGYMSHLRVAQELLIAYEVAPENFRDGDLNIPESGNGVPDIIDEAAWLPRYCHRLRQELLTKKYGSGGISLRVAGDAFGSDTGPNDVGRGSWQDVDRIWAVSGEDPESTFRYAGVAAHLAIVLKKLNRPDPEKVDWAKEAREAFAWAESKREAYAKQYPSHAAPMEQHRQYARATLFRLTRDDRYRPALAEANISAEVPGDWQYAFFALALDPDPAVRATGGADQLTLKNADFLVAASDRRSMRWASLFSMPMLVGHLTTPVALGLGVGYRMTQSTDPERSRRYREVMYTTADYFLGTNSLNMTWITGVGPRPVEHIFHMDAWYNGKGRYHPGLMPYSPWIKQKNLGQGPWDVDWPNQTLFPPIDSWPGAERWFNNRCSPLGAEFTVHQNTGPAAAFYGMLLPPAR